MSSRLETPQEVPVDGTNSPHFTNFSPQADDLDTHMCALFDYDISIIGELRWGGTGIIFDLVRDKMSGDEQPERACLGKEAVRINSGNDCVDHFVLERPPNDSTIANGELSQAAAGKDTPLRYIKCIHNGDHIVVAGACPFDILD